ncbi:MAG: acetyl-CoA carboxylase biotin carboxyl carrier protein [Chloroherpetonaceae bacterium]|nr:acetyl-CoA carboxylase biotin carboxyl carrier protein [Chloroherpetonaceae bacterium]MDW8438011.1 acetyl-CoA carboxylase biotin carboxyl carrier protein [Chloroherpetonaceae bacterium]
MNLDDIQRLIKMVDESGLDEMTIEEGEFKLTLRKTAEHATSASAMPIMMPPPYLAPALPAAPQATAAPAPAKPAEPSAPAPAPAEPAKKYKEIRSPMVGTFYRAPAPDANPYVQVGDTITKGKVLCIIEAMKLMNEIESDVDGKIVKILVENGKPVEFDQVLFLVE